VLRHPTLVAYTGSAARFVQAGGGLTVRHCPECRRVYRSRVDVCSECWATIVPGKPPERRRLSLVYETSAGYEADMVEGLLHAEGIPCLRVPGHGALPYMLTGALFQASMRLYVRTDMAPQAAALIAEVTRSDGPA